MSFHHKSIPIDARSRPMQTLTLVKIKSSAWIQSGTALWSILIRRHSNVHHTPEAKNHDKVAGSTTVAGLCNSKDRRYGTLHRLNPSIKRLYTLSKQSTFSHPTPQTFLVVGLACLLLRPTAFCAVFLAERSSKIHLRLSAPPPVCNRHPTWASLGRRATLCLPYLSQTNVTMKDRSCLLG
jgi:hypothetical protein